MKNLNKTTKIGHCEQSEAIFHNLSQIATGKALEMTQESTRHCERSEAISSRFLWTKVHTKTPALSSRAHQGVVILPRLLRQFFPRNDKARELAYPNGLAMTNETGRSLVEMLSVLAVMGVLSIAGVIGYKSAIERHRANEILNELSQRALSVSAKIQNGETTVSESHFAMHTYLPTGVAYFGANNTNLNGQFKITLTYESGFDSTSVCKRMKKYAGEDSIIYSINDTCTEFVYNNDLSTGEPTVTVDPDEEEKQNCRYSQCQTCVKDAQGNVSRGFEPATKECTQSGLKGKCNGWGQCVPTEGESCNSVSGCSQSGYFCNYGGNYTPNKCEKATAKTKMINGVTYYYASLIDLKSWCRPADGNNNCTWGYLSYYGAQSWCRTIGKQMISLSDFNIIGEFLPKNGASSYWGNNLTWWRSSTENGNAGSTDGYYDGGGVVCK